MKPALGWAAFWSLFGITDGRLTAQGLSFSQTLRRVFRTDTKKGRTHFTLCLLAGGFVFWLHIIKGKLWH